MVEKSPTLMEFDDLNGKLAFSLFLKNTSCLLTDTISPSDPEDEPFAEIKKGLTSIIHQINWFDDDDYLKPQVTRQVADESLNPITTPNKSYITLTKLSPRTPLSSNVERVRLQTPTISNLDNQENSPTSVSVTSTPASISVMDTPASISLTSTPKTHLSTSTPEQTPNSNQSMKLFPLFTPSSAKKVLSE